VLAVAVAGGSAKGPPPARRVLCYRYRARLLLFAVVRVRECIVFFIAAAVVIAITHYYKKIKYIYNV